MFFSAFYSNLSWLFLQLYCSIFGFVISIAISISYLTPDIPHIYSRLIALSSHKFHAYNQCQGLTSIYTHQVRPIKGITLTWSSDSTI